MLYTTQDKIWVRQQDDFKRMYPDNDINNGYVVWLNCRFFISYGYENINPFFRLYNKSGEKLDTPKYKLRKLFPNPNYLSICMKSGRKLSDLGMILYFDSFKQLNEVSTIVFGFSSDVITANINIIIGVKIKFHLITQSQKRITLFQLLLLHYVKQMK